MKKLIVAMAVAVIGIAVNASTAAWNSDSIYAYDKEDGGGMADGYLVYFVDVNYVGQSAAINFIKAGNFDFLDNEKVSAAWYTSSGATMGESADIYGKDSDGGDTVAETVTGYLVVLNSETVPADATYAYVSGTSDGTTTTVGGSANIYFEDSKLVGAKDHTNWTQVAPEPTSGLLLLIGVAGLALKRRRA